MWQAARSNSAILLLSAITALGGCAATLPATSGSLDFNAVAPPRIDQAAPTELQLPESADQTQRRFLALSIGELLEFAREEHPLLDVANERTRAARAQVEPASSYANPQFVVDVETPTNETGTGPSSALGPTSMTFRVMVPIQTASKQQHRRDVAIAALHRAHVTRDVEEAKILAATVDAASDVLYLQAALQMQENVAELARQRASSIPSYATALPTGELKVTNKIGAERDATRYRLQLLETRRQLAVARLALARAVGAPPELEIQLTDDLADLPRSLLSQEEVIALARQRSPAIAEALAGVVEGRETYSLARAESIPDFEIGPRYNDDFDTDGPDRIGVRFGMDLPVFDHNEGEIAAAAGTVHVNRARLRLAEHEAASDAVALYLELNRVQESIQVYREQADALTSQYDKIINNPKVRGLFSIEQKLDFRLQQAEQLAEELKLRQREYRLRHRLEILLGQPVCRRESVSHDSEG